MSPEINFIALLGDSLLKEFDSGLEDLNDGELREAAREHFDSLTEEELRELYREGTITIEDAFETEKM